MFGKEQSVGAETSKARSVCVRTRVDRTVDHAQLPLALVWGCGHTCPYMQTQQGLGRKTDTQICFSFLTLMLVRATEQNTDLVPTAAPTQSPSSPSTHPLKPSVDPCPTCPSTPSSGAPSSHQQPHRIRHPTCAPTARRAVLTQGSGNWLGVVPSSRGHLECLETFSVITSGHSAITVRDDASSLRSSRQPRGEEVARPRHQQCQGWPSLASTEGTKSSLSLHP